MRQKRRFQRTYRSHNLINEAQGQKEGWPLLGYGLTRER